MQNTCFVLILIYKKIILGLQVSGNPQHQTNSHTETCETQVSEGLRVSGSLRKLGQKIISLTFKNQMIHKEGIVYTLKSPDNKYYVGTTRRAIEKTLVHLKSYAKTGKNVSSNEIIKSGDYRAEVLEAHKDITSAELKKRAGLIQTKLGDKCVNVLKAGRTQKDANVRKELYQQNKMEAKRYFKTASELSKRKKTSLTGVYFRSSLNFLTCSMSASACDLDIPNFFLNASREASSSLSKTPSNRASRT